MSLCPHPLVRLGQHVVQTWSCNQELTHKYSLPGAYAKVFVRLGLAGRDGGAESLLGCESEHRRQQGALSGEAGLLLLNPIPCSLPGRNSAGCESQCWLLRSDVPFVATARAGSEVSAKAGLIEAFLLIRSRINERGFVSLLAVIQEASPQENSLCWSRGLNCSGSTGIPVLP